ncbi:MAG: hypothetical protein PHN74_02225 [Candidatus Pacebacteria bacterium]|nr:hypothetical protein [Candidatus Paceibacterota bacterium]
MENYSILGKILGVGAEVIERLDRIMSAKTGKKGVIDKVAKENEKTINVALNLLNSANRSTEHVYSILRQTILNHEKELIDFLKVVEGKDEFEKAAKLAKEMSSVKKGFFLKKKFAEEILRKRPSGNLLKYLKLKNIEEVLSKYDISEVFSVLRFIETDEWMHKTFEVAYSGLKAEDFEEREVEIKVLGPEWKSVAEKFVAKKHHNVSHLKEFGVIFLNPIKENIPGKFLRDFALIFHYFHEIEFYSKLFRKYSTAPDFAEHLKAFLRGDVKEVYEAKDGEWLIVQRYLAKENPNDARLLLPRINPESLHWMRGERDLTLFVSQEAKMNLRLWNDLDWVGGIFKDGKEDVVSFDLEDNAMSLVSFMEGKKDEFFNYHQREAMWTKIFSEYVGGEEKMEKLLLDNFDKGVIKF